MIPFEAIPNLGIEKITDSRMAVFHRGGNYYLIAPKTYKLARYVCTADDYNKILDQMESNSIS